MRRRALLLAFLVAGLASATGAAIGTGAVPWHDSPGNATALARGDLADAAAPTALSRVRDQLGRDHDVRRDVAAALGIALILTLSGGWWLARERAARALHRRPSTTRRTRAPPLVPTTVHC
ncbi:MAG TPA: hypothetical protein VGN51_00230 [Acidimicrobiia bacterium]|jgi:hypothetical protein